MGSIKNKVAWAVVGVLCLLFSACSGGEETSTTKSSSETPTAAATNPTATANPVSKPTATQSASARDGGSTHTNVIIVQLSVVPGEDIWGLCWTASLVVARPNAWRCMEKNLIHDPCFSQSGTDPLVICPNGQPWEMTGVRMNLTEPLPEPPAEHKVEDPYKAWALELVDGTRCTFMTGATFAVDTKRGNYACGEDWWIIGAPQIDDVWTVEKVIVDSNFKASQSVNMAVRTAWR